MTSHSTPFPCNSSNLLISIGAGAVADGGHQADLVAGFVQHAVDQKAGCGFAVGAGNTYDFHLPRRGPAGQSIEQHGLAQMPVWLYSPE
jgi:hypothetical protein